MLLLLVVFLNGCKVEHDTEFLPDQEEEECHVWISQEPKAFITRAYGIRGGLLEVHGELRPVLACIDDAIFGMCINDLETVEFPDGETWKDKSGQESFSEAVENEGKPYISYISGTEYIGHTYLKYTAQSMILSTTKKSPEFSGKTLTFERYSKSEVLPTDFGFELENWDDFPYYPYQQQERFNDLPVRTDQTDLIAHFPWTEIQDCQWKLGATEGGRTSVCGWITLLESTLSNWKEAYDWRTCGITAYLLPEDMAVENPQLLYSPKYQQALDQKLTDAKLRVYLDFENGYIYFTGVFLESGNETSQN